MQLQPSEYAILRKIAHEHGLAANVLADAITHESSAELALALDLAPDEAAERMARIRRAVTIGDDWGAGCKLLTDDVRTELHAALQALSKHSDHSASSGVSHG